MAYNSKFKGTEVEEALSLAMTALQEIPKEYATQSYVDDAINELREDPGADMMLDGYIPLSRDFNDDFNDDFAR